MILSRRQNTLIVVYLISVLSFAARAAILIDVSPHNVKLGQTFKIILTQEGSSRLDTPLLSVLQSDFMVMGTEQSASYSMINGQISSHRQWIILLQPKKSGTLIIPPIPVGKEKTTASSIEVRAASSSVSLDNENSNKATHVKNKDVFLTALVSNKTPYVNEQVIYTVKLYRNQNLLDASYQSPKVDNALLIPLGNGLRYQKLKNGQMYTVEEQRYAIFPQKSGSLTISAPSLNTLLYNGLMPEQISVSAAELTLSVQPALANRDKSIEWIPAKKLMLYEYYDKKETAFAEGATLQRKIMIEGVGLPAQLLPKLTIEKNKDFSVYQEKGLEKNQLKNNELIGKKSFKLTYLLNKPGTIQIPEQKLSWFNSQTKQEETITLPARALHIQANPTLVSSRQPVSPTPITTERYLKANQTTIKPTENPWWWIAATFAFLWIMTLLLWWKGKTLFGKTKDKKLKQQLKLACINNQPELARGLLIDWGKVSWPGELVLDLADIIRLSNDESLNEEIKLLIKSLYQSKAKPWQGGQTLWHRISAYKKCTVKPKTGKGVLPPSNPI